MKTLRERFMLLRSADGGEGGGGAPASPENVLFPNDVKPGGEGGEGGEKTPASASAGKDGGDGGKADWQEYVNDPAKSEAENAAAKAEHDKTKPAADDKGGDDPANKVPDDGKYELTMPDGVEVDQALLDAVAPEFKELGLTRAQAQKLADKFISVQQAGAAKRMEDWSATVQKWADDAKADKEIGGSNWDTTVKNALRAVDRLGTPALKEYLGATGGGNHPEVIRVMAKVGAMIKEDDPAVGGAEGKGKPAEPAHILFPNDAPKG